MPGDTICAESRHGLLRDTGLHSEHPRRHSVVGVFLDQRRRLASARLARSAHCTDDDHHERWSPRVSASCVLHQGCRRMDDSLPVVRVLVVHRVRRRQRAGTSSVGDKCACACTWFTLLRHRVEVDDEPPSQ